LKLKIQFCIAVICVSLYGGLALAQPSAQAEVPDSRPGKANGLFEQLQQWGAQIHEVRENRKIEAAREQIRATISKNEVKQFELVTKGGTIPQGGTFVRLQPFSNNSLRAGNETVSPPFGIGGGIELQGTQLTAEKKQEMQRRVETLKKEEQALKAAEEAQRKAKDAAEAAEKARQQLEQEKKAAAQATQLADAAREQQLRAEKAAREAARQEAAAMRDGRRAQQEISDARARYILQGGPFRAPAGGAN